MITIDWTVPFFHTIFSSDNFDEIVSYENYNLKIEKFDDRVEISFKNTYSTNVFIYEKDDKYWMCLNPYKMYEQFNKDDMYVRYKTFEKLILTKNDYTFIDDENTMWSVDILSDEAINILNKWISKYKDIIGNIDTKQFIIEQSSGIDTRILTYFWRNTGKTYDMFTILREGEIEHSMDVINFLNENFPSKTKVYNDYNDIPKDCAAICVCGLNLVNGKNEMTEFESYDKLCKERNNMTTDSFSFHFTKHEVCDIQPFVDKEYLKIKGEFNGQLKLVLFDILASEKGLNKLPIVSFNNSLYDINNPDYPYKHIADKLRDKLIY